MEKENKILKILCLDGGGSKGLYTLGVLSELEKELGKKIYEHFDLIFGTSTGAIIAAMLATGYSIKDVRKKYQDLIPKIMGTSGQKNKSKVFNKLCKGVFGEQKFDSFKTGIGIVAMNYDTQEPLVFKNNINTAHGVKASFEPGFGVTIADAVEASCAACPIFCKKKLHTTNKGDITAIDGGFIANNPSLFALIDATKALKYNEEQIAILSIGVGTYIEKPINKKLKFLSKFEMAQIASKVLIASSNTTEVVTRLLFSNLNIERINDTFHQPEHGTNMIEKNQEKLDKMFQLGIGSYAKHEKRVKEIVYLS